MYDKYTIIGWNDYLSKRGAYSEAYNLQSKYSSYINVLDGYKLISNDIDKIHDNSKRVIYTYQDTTNYRKKNLIHIKYYHEDIVYCRYEINPGVKYKTTNGFSSYKSNSSFVNYVPMLLPTEFKYNTNVITDKIVLGYYYRPVYRYDDFIMFCNFVKELNIDVELYVMGGYSSPYPFDKLNSHIKNIIYTKDNNIFFSNITHYVYSESEVHDPYPTTLQEAVNTNKQIIFLEKNRNFKDGISDIKELIKYHTYLDTEIYHDNSDCILNKWNYNNFYSIVFDNNFIYNFDRDKYKYFGDWLSQW